MTVRVDYIDGDMFVVPSSDTDSIYYHSGTDRQNIDVGLKHVPLDRRQVCVQAGGNLGFFPREYAKAFERVITFEPDPLNFFCLTQNAKASNIVKLQACVGEVRGDWVDIEVPDARHVGLNRVSKTSTTPKYPVFAIDDLELPACDFIQLDLEGYEYAALKGAVSTIEKYKPVLQIECANHWTHYGVSENKVVEFLTSLGYEEIDSIWLDRIFVAK